MELRTSPRFHFTTDETLLTCPGEDHQPTAERRPTLPQGDPRIHVVFQSTSPDQGLDPGSHEPWRYWRWNQGLGINSRRFKSTPISEFYFMKMVRAPFVRLTLSESCKTCSIRNCMYSDVKEIESLIRKRLECVQLGLDLKSTSVSRNRELGAESDEV